MKVALLMIVVLTPLRALAGAFIVYTDEQVFDNLWPGLPIETFEEANIANGDASPCSSPLSELSIDSCFQPGDIIPGLSLSDLPGPGAMAAFAPGWFGISSKMVAPNVGIDTLIVEFDQPVNIVGFRMHTWGANEPDTPMISIFDDDGVLIDGFRIDATLSGSFLGLESVDGIKRLEILSAVDSPEGIDDVRFGMLDVLIRDGFE